MNLRYTFQLCAFFCLFTGTSTLWANHGNDKKPEPTVVAKQTEPTKKQATNLIGQNPLVFNPSDSSKVQPIADSLLSKYPYYIRKEHYLTRPPIGNIILPYNMPNKGNDINQLMMDAQKL